MVRRCAQQIKSAQQKKAVPAKNSEAIFWRPRFTRPLRAGERANANFACSEGFFCVQCAAPCGGLVVLARPAAAVRTFVPDAPACFLPVLRRLVPGLWAVCRFCVWLGLACAAAVYRLPAVRLVCAHFSLVSLLFLPNFFLSKLFSLVAQAATGLYFLPKRK